MQLLRGTFVATFWLAGCDAVSTPSSGDPVPVIQAVLTVGASRHAISITWSVPTDSTFTFQGPARPVDPSEVNLRLLGSAGLAIPVTSTANPGDFEVAAEIQPGASYALQGTVAGRSISATVTTPGAFVISLPAGDTIRLTEPEGGIRQVHYLWHVAGARAYSAKQFLASVLPESDSTGILRFSLGAPDTTKLTLLALEVNAASFFLPQATEPRGGNIVGALGVLGAISIIERVFIWE